MSSVKKAVFPVAGLGSRFLPATKASPKEMLPIVDKPLIQYAVEEAAAAGMTEMIFVTGRNKRAIEDHFDKAYELESELERAQKTEMLSFVRNMLPKNVSYIFTRQAEALGLGHAVLCARPVVGNEPFAVILADDLMEGSPPIMRQMADVYAAQRCSLLGVMDVAREETRRYGIVKSDPCGEHLERISGIVEKPSPEKAPSTLAVVGRYILTPGIFRHLETVRSGAGGEIQLTDALMEQAKQGGVVAYKFRGRRFDCGSVSGFVAATNYFYHMGNR